jgi:hypothetical protein
MFPGVQIKNYLANKVVNKFIDYSDAVTRIQMVSADLLSRGVAYELDKHMIPEKDYNQEYVIDLLDADGVTRQYLPRHIYVPIKGLVCYILIAANPQENSRIHLMFRGTKDLPACVRNCETGGPGSESFLENKYIILENLKTDIELYYGEQDIDLIISGHSLGGADTENTLAAIMQTMAQLHNNNLTFKYFENFKRIKTLTANISNPAGIIMVRGYESQMDAKFLAMEHSVKIRLMYIITDGDIVPQSGQTHILLNCEENIAQVNLIKISKQWTGLITGQQMSALSIVAAPFSFPAAVILGTLGTLMAAYAHKAKFTHETQLNEDNYEIFSNNNHEGRASIAKKLNKHVLNNSITTIIANNIKKSLLFRKTIMNRIPLDQDFVLIDHKEFQSDEFFTFTNTKTKLIKDEKLFVISEGEEDEKLLEELGKKSDLETYKS